MYCKQCDKYMGEPKTGLVNIFICHSCAVDYVNTKNLNLADHERALEALSHIYDTTFK